MDPHDEFAEIDLTEAEIDAMMAEGESVKVGGPLRLRPVGGLYVITTVPPTRGGVSEVRNIMPVGYLSVEPSRVSA